MENKYAIGVDLGATNLRVAVVADNGNVEFITKTKVQAHKSPTAIVDLICKNIESILAKNVYKIIGCGMGIPGIVDSEKGIIFQSPNFPEWNDFHLKSELKKRINLPIVIDNDANMFALAELLQGAGKGNKNLISITLGSGIGGGLILNGEVFHGDRGFAGEIGHIVVEADGVQCSCGSKGCWEQYAASKSFHNLICFLEKKEIDFIMSKAENDISKLTPELIGRLADEQNEVAYKLWALFSKYLGVGIASLINTLGVTCIVIGGGIINSWDHFALDTKQEIACRTYKQNVASLKLLKGIKGDNTGVVGAALSILKS